MYFVAKLANWQCYRAKSTIGKRSRLSMDLWWRGEFKNGDRLAVQAESPSPDWIEPFTKTWRHLGRPVWGSHTKSLDWLVFVRAMGALYEISLVFFRKHGVNTTCACVSPRLKIITFLFFSVFSVSPDSKCSFWCDNAHWSPYAAAETMRLVRTKHVYVPDSYFVSCLVNLRRLSSDLIPFFASATSRRPDSSSTNL